MIFWVPIIKYIILNNRSVLSGNSYYYHHYDDYYYCYYQTRTVHWTLQCQNKAKNRYI